MKIRSRFLFSMVAAALAIQGNAQQKQNVIFFLVDDLGWNDISRNGSELYETPNIDELANNAVYFENAYAAFPRCVPSRYAMMTGIHPARNTKEQRNLIRGEEVTLGEALKANGYATFFAGKWHIGHSEEFWPHHNGFDVNKGGCDMGAPGSYFFPFGDSSGKFENPYMYGLEDGIEGEYITDRLTKETTTFIEDNRDKPFFVYLAHYAVHTPFQAKQDRVAYYENKLKNLSFEGEPYIIGPDGKAKMWQDNAVYAAMVESMDESLGTLINKLKELGLYDNTIIIFTSDHGGLSNTGPKNKRELATTNKPLRAGKGHIYEGGIKVPVMVRWPGVTKGGSVTGEVITGMDYFPSILEMCGLPLLPEEHVDGKSFVPALKGEIANQERTYYWHQDNARPSSTGDHNSSVIRKGRYKLHYFLDDHRMELYDLYNDPFEKENLTEKNPGLAKEMFEELLEWKCETNVRDPEPDKN